MSKWGRRLVSQTVDPTPVKKWLMVHAQFTDGDMIQGTHTSNQENYTLNYQTRGGTRGEPKIGGGGR